MSPLNSFLYNMDSSNLAQHGLHPRLTHFLVNAPMVCGPLFLVVIALACRAAAARSTGTPEHGLLLATVFLPLALLSTAPHQEARFLLPLVIPTVLLGVDFLFPSPHAKRASDEGSGDTRPVRCRAPRHGTAMLWLWFAYNAALTLFWGSLHQGGILPALAYLKTSAVPAVEEGLHQQQQHVMFFHTYMPPLHLLALPPAHADESPIVIHDLRGASCAALSETVGALRDAGHKHVSLVAPPHVATSCTDGQHGLALRERRRFFPHVHLDDGVDFLVQLVMERSSPNEWRHALSLHLYDVDGLAAD